MFLKFFQEQKRRGPSFALFEASAQPIPLVARPASPHPTFEMRKENNPTGVFALHTHAVFRLDLAAAFHGAGHGDFVGVFDVAAGWDAGGDPGDLYGVAGLAGVMEGCGQPVGGGFALECGAGGEDDFVDFAALDAGEQVCGAELVRADAVQRREGAVEDVVDALVAAGAFDGLDAGGLFDDADKALVADRAGAVDAGIDVRDVVADGAEAKAGFQGAHGVGERGGVFVAGAQEMKGEALGALGADSGELLQFVNEPGHWLGIT